jgi:hypothetical protein
MALMRRSVLVMAALAALAATAQADEATLVEFVKWLQLPNMGPMGFDYSSQRLLPQSTSSQSRVADDFLCSDPRAIDCLNVWGSYWTAPFVGTFSGYWSDPSFAAGPTPVMPNIVTGFQVDFYANVPIGVDPTMHYGHPGALLHSLLVPASEVSASLTGVIDRTGDGVIGNLGDEAVWEYRVPLSKPFDQTPGTIYWLSVQAQTAAGTPIQWGWHNADELNGNNAVQNGPREWGSAYNVEWVLLPDVDMAFQLEVPEPVTAALLGVGLVGMLFSRRRKA